MFAKLLQQPRQSIVKFGYAGVVFFSVKGVLWLVLPLIFAWYLQ